MITKRSTPITIPAMAPPVSTYAVMNNKMGRTNRVTMIHVYVKLNVLHVYAIRLYCTIIMSTDLMLYTYIIPASFFFSEMINFCQTMHFYWLTLVNTITITLR